jgi:hypothetical protein
MTNQSPSDLGSARLSSQNKKLVDLYEDGRQLRSEGISYSPVERVRLVQNKTVAIKKLGLQGYLTAVLHFVPKDPDDYPISGSEDDAFVTALRKADKLINLCMERLEKERSQLDVVLKNLFPTDSSRRTLRLKELLAFRMGIQERRWKYDGVDEAPDASEILEETNKEFERLQEQGCDANELELLKYCLEVGRRKNVLAQSRASALLTTSLSRRARKTPEKPGQKPKITTAKRSLEKEVRRKSKKP